jgi:hypothetical protein
MAMRGAHSVGSQGSCAQIPVRGLDLVRAMSFVEGRAGVKVGIRTPIRKR